MSETNEPTERIETPEEVALSEQDKRDLESLDVEVPKPSFHPVLKVWQEALRPAYSEAKKRVITPQWASQMVDKYPKMAYDQLPLFHSLYFERLIELVKIVDLEISEDNQCTTYDNPADDVEFNSEHYINVITNWNLTFLKWELGWDCTSPDAAVEVATLQELYPMFFGSTGITAFLDTIGFQFTDADQENLASVLEEFKNAELGGEV